MDNPLQNLETQMSACSLNSPNEDGNTPLHNAVQENKLRNCVVQDIVQITFVSSIEMVEYLLQQPHINLNAQNCYGETPTSLGVSQQTSEALLMRLIGKGPDVNIPDYSKTTPLHVAVLYGWDGTARELIRWKADVNAQDNRNWTPLHFAVESDDIEVLSLLLYYGADIHLVNMEKRSPLAYALFDSRFSAVKILIDYYDNFDNVDLDGCTDLHLALLCNSPHALALQMIEAGADVNCFTDAGCSVLELSLLQDSAEVFKAIWPRLDDASFFNSSAPFLYTYIKSRVHFRRCEWVECFYLIIESPIAFDLMEDCNKYLDKQGGKVSFFSELLLTFHTLEVEVKDRIAMICICLSLGAEIYSIADFDSALTWYGFEDELELLLYTAADVTCKMLEYSAPHSLLLFILGVEDFQVTTAFRLCNMQLRQERLNIISNSLDFFSLPCHMKQEVSDWCETCSFSCEDVVEKLQKNPDVPSLQELCRNRMHKFIRQSCVITKPYQFQDAVKNLKLPQKIKDILRFKVPIY